MVFELTPLANAGIAGVAVAALYFSWKLSNGVLKNNAAALREITFGMTALRESTHRDHLEIITLIKDRRGKRRSS